MAPKRIAARAARATPRAIGPRTVGPIAIPTLLSGESSWRNPRRAGHRLLRQAASPSVRVVAGRRERDFRHRTTDVVGVDEDAQPLDEAIVLPFHAEHANHRQHQE